MKNEILDIPFRETIDDFLVKGETIVWKGSPTENFNSLYKFDKHGKIRLELKDYISLFVILGIFLMIMAAVAPIDFLIMIIGILTLVFTIRIHQARKLHPTEYIITQKRILFKQTDIPNKIHQIHFSNISDLEIRERYDNVGTIFLNLRQPSLVNFSTYSMKRSDGMLLSYTENIDNTLKQRKRSQPTLEVISDVDRVATFIQEGIKNANTLA